MRLPEFLQDIMSPPAANPTAEKPRPVKRERLAWLGAAMALFAISSLANAAQSKGRYNDGEFVGTPADTQWGAVQVKVVVHDGALTDVQFMQYPSHRRRSAEISSWALPALRSEAIKAQSSQVDVVSQATTTAYGFQQSLAAALSHAAK